MVVCIRDLLSNTAAASYRDVDIFSFGYQTPGEMIALFLRYLEHGRSEHGHWKDPTSTRNFRTGIYADTDHHGARFGTVQDCFESEKAAKSLCFQFK